MKVSNSKERLQEMMNILDIKQSDIVKRTGIQKSSLSNYISGRRIPRQDQLSIIADPYGINPAWLMGYDVPMRYDVVDYEVEDEDLKVLIETCSGMSNESKKALINYAEYLYQLDKAKGGGL